MLIATFILLLLNAAVWCGVAHATNTQFRDDESRITGSGRFVLVLSLLIAMANLALLVFLAVSPCSIIH